MLLLLGKNRFGPPDARTRAALERIEDVGQFEEMASRTSRAGMRFCAGLRRVAGTAGAR